MIDAFLWVVAFTACIATFFFLISGGGDLLDYLVFDFGLALDCNRYYLTFLLSINTYEYSLAFIGTMENGKTDMRMSRRVDVLMLLMHNYKLVYFKPGYQHFHPLDASPFLK
jgi:hypothetical protein